MKFRTIALIFIAIFSLTAAANALTISQQCKKSAAAKALKAGLAKGSSDYKAYTKKKSKSCINKKDRDKDNVLDSIDNCYGVANPDQADSDGDGLGDLCDPAFNDDDDDSGPPASPTPPLPPTPPASPTPPPSPTPPGGGTPTPSPTPPSGGSTCTELPAVFASFSSSVNVYLSGDKSKVVIESDGSPDHASSYFDSGDPNYTTACPAMHANAFTINSQNYVFQIPCVPTVAGSTTATTGGAIGVALNGVPLFDSYAAMGTVLDDEAGGFDILKDSGTCQNGEQNGHPTPGNIYHYHVAPARYTYQHLSALVGFILDGFPLYGPEDMDGSTPSNLDECNGHTAATADYPGGIYHYHTKYFDLNPPYTADCYRGTKGTATN